MSDEFNRFIERVLSHEGGYVNHPQDPGGETNWGITKRTAQANGYNGSMRAMTREQAISIYRKAFWERYRADQMPEAVAFQFFDACVNHGYGNAARMLQRAAGVPDDGIIGEISLKAINSASRKRPFIAVQRRASRSFIPSWVRSPLSARAGYAVWRKT